MVKFALLNFLGVVLVLFGCAHPQPFSSFEEAVGKLNTPKLIDEYQKAWFTYATYEEGGGCANAEIGLTLLGCPPYFIFRNRGRGNCGAFTTFAVHCLRKAGYEAYPLYVHHPWSANFNPGKQPRDFHIVTLFKENGNWYTMDNGLPTSSGIDGPFSKVENTHWVIKIDKGWEWKRLEIEMMEDLEKYFKPSQ